MVVPILMESIGNHFSFLFTTLYNKIFTKEILTAILFKTILNQTIQGQKQSTIIKCMKLNKKKTKNINFYAELLKTKKVVKFISI